MRRSGDGRQAEDWLGSHSSGTSKPQALTVPRGERETRFDVWRARGGSVLAEDGVTRTRFMNVDAEMIRI